MLNDNKLLNMLYMHKKIQSHLDQSYYKPSVSGIGLLSLLAPPGQSLCHLRDSL